MLRLDGVTRRFGAVTAVDDVSLEVAPGEILSLLGPSGCGKTTTLRMVAGFETPTAGRVVLDGADVTALPPQRRGMGMVFQNYALFPHLDVGENVEFGLRARGMRGAEARAQAARSLARVELAGYERRRVQELSGGQQQRVALARALAPEPRVVLLDEPLSNLDAALRERTRDELRSLLKGLGITAVFVTHDQEEAFALADRIAVLRAGRLQQVDAPEALYAAPATAFVAGFLGRASFVPATVETRDGHGVVCALGDGTRCHARPAPGFAPAPGAAVRLMLRPESLRVVREGGDGARDGEALRGVVRDRRFAGATTFYRVDVAGRDVLAEGRPGDAAAGDAVRLPLAAAAPLAYPAEDEA